MKVGIVGAGYAGTSAASWLVLHGIATEIVLIDVNRESAAGHAEYILRASLRTQAAKIVSGGFQNLSDTGAVVLACGASRKKMETYPALMRRNAGIFRAVVKKVIRHAPQAILIVAASPVDLLTQLVTDLVGKDPHRVIGSGTILDTARFRNFIAGHLRISPQSVHANVLGEHGDSEVLIWSSTRVDGMQLDEFARQIGKPIDDEYRTAIDEKVRRAAGRNSNGSGADCSGIGAGISRIIKAIRDDEGAILTVTSFSEGEPGIGKVCMSVPRIIKNSGAGDELWPELSDEEYSALQESADRLIGVVGAIGHS